ncbi:MAG TPA: 4-oxalocrotonate tautomerase [Stellaceae bacterium]|jgi:4-oxalocrotonate tautomerase
MLARSGRRGVKPPRTARRRAAAQAARTHRPAAPCAARTDWTLCGRAAFPIAERNPTVPLIRIEMFEGRSIEQKRELVEALTRETARIARCAPEAVSIIIDDIKKENWATAGKLASDK